ncbi:MAG: PIG-L family deacetylase [Candidatus Tectomicrobia bacterium]|uniref:PIG-L family deacetylase n=1 Tax=Tectimicrobiota bacterium TaxID=2528274 RepID=A0A932MQF8_UNCTE|nr:PIG-L family deacetylase [Candidatus Tectomicrobia bacterium]
MEHRTILFIAAHPDDLEFRSAGSAAVWAGQGRRVEYCLCTSGEKGFNGNGSRGLSLEERWTIREAEQRAAAEVLGVADVHFLRHPDGELENTPDLRRDLVRMMRRVKPDLVVSGDPAMASFDSFYGYHRDHRSANQAIFDALYPAVGNPNFFPELLAEGLEPHHPKEVYFSHPAKPDVWVDIAPVFEIKMRALACHKSQIGDVEELISHMRDWSKRMAEGSGLECAESYRRLEVPG